MCKKLLKGLRKMEIDTQNTTKVETNKLKVLSPEMVLGQFRAFAKSDTRPTEEVLALFHKVAKAYRTQHSKEKDKGLSILKSDLLDINKTKSWISYLSLIQNPPKNQNQRKGQRR